MDQGLLRRQGAEEVRHLAPQGGKSQACSIADLLLEAFMLLPGTSSTWLPLCPQAGGRTNQELSQECKIGLTPGLCECDDVKQA